MLLVVIGSVFRIDLVAVLGLHGIGSQERIHGQVRILVDCHKLFDNAPQFLSFDRQQCGSQSSQCDFFC